MPTYYKTTTMKGRQKTLGVVDGDVFKQSINYKKAYFIKGNALGIDVSLIPELQSKGVKAITLTDEKGTKYTASFELLLTKGWEHRFAGFQPKQFLAMNHWVKEEVNG